MTLIIEAVRDEIRGPYYFFHGTVDEEKHHAFAGSADDLDTAYDMAKECIADQLEFAAKMRGDI